MRRPEQNEAARALYRDAIALLLTSVALTTFLATQSRHGDPLTASAQKQKLFIAMVAMVAMGL